MEFEKGGKQCGMRFLDSDVRKPLAAVSAMNDEGNTVVFSRRWGNYVENDETKERIKMERVRDTDRDGAANEKARGRSEERSEVGRAWRKEIRRHGD